MPETRALDSSSGDSGSVLSSCKDSSYFAKGEGFRLLPRMAEKVMLDSKSLEQPKGLLEAFPEIDEVRIYTEAAMDCYDKSCRQKRFMTGILMIIWNINIGHWKKQMEYR